MVKFRDKNGREYLLSQSTYEHIKKDHCIDNPYVFIKETLLEPFAIIEDRTKSDRWIYHKDHKRNLYKVVVVCLTDKRIKTAFISGEVKGGKIIWIDKQNLIG